ncbi:MAG: hypothetical protein KAR07_09215, partial [Spirochaetes bacterium]|nr:hypothetical protein [Spirochaetota bacterium]
MHSVDELAANARVFIYGNGVGGHALLVLLEKLRPDVRVIGFIDTFLQGRYRGKKVYRFRKFIRKFSPKHYNL